MILLNAHLAQQPILFHKNSPRKRGDEGHGQPRFCQNLGPVVAGKLPESLKELSFLSTFFSVASA